MQIPVLHPDQPITRTQNRLPHWTQEHATYFITFHLADSIPSSLLKQWREERDIWLKFHPEPWTSDHEREYHQRFSMMREKWLDAAHGECLLRQPAIRQCVVDCLLKYDGDGYQMQSWVVMPNHVHLLVTIQPEHSLAKLVKSWKGVSANHIRKVHFWTGTALWQKDYFDRMIRDHAHFLRVANYIRNNPIKAHLKSNEYSFGEAAFPATS